MGQNLSNEIYNPCSILTSIFVDGCAEELFQPDQYGLASNFVFFSENHLRTNANFSVLPVFRQDYVQISPAVGREGEALGENILFFVAECDGLTRNHILGGQNS